MLENVNAVLNDPGEGEESDRIDALLSSALADQARERRMLVETVFGAKSALVKAQEEVNELREFISKRDEALLEAFSKQNEALAESVAQKLEAAQKSINPPRDAGLGARVEAIEDGILQLAKRIAELPSQMRKQLDEHSSQLRRDLEISAVAIGDRIGEESASLLADLRDDQVEVIQTLAAMSEAAGVRVTDALVRAEQELMERVSITGRDTIEGAASAVEQMVEHLTGYLQARDEQMYRARDQRLVELFQHLSDTIGRSTKRKLSKTLSENPRPGSGKPLAPPMPPVKAPPPMSVSRSIRPPGGEQTEAMRSPFSGPPPAGRPQEHPGPSRSDPAFAFDQPPDDPFDLRRSRSERDGSTEGTRPSDGPEAAFGGHDRPHPNEVLGAREPTTGPLSNPLTRAELKRDYLIAMPQKGLEESPSHSGRVQSVSADDRAGGGSRQGAGRGRGARGPATGRTRRKG